MTFAIKLTRTTSAAPLPTGITAGAVRFQLLSAADNSVVATFDDPSAGISYQFAGVADASLIPSVQDLDSNGNPLGTAVTGGAFTPSDLVAGVSGAASSTGSASAAATYSATSSVAVSAAAE